MLILAFEFCQPKGWHPVHEEKVMHDVAIGISFILILLLPSVIALSTGRVNAPDNLHR